MLHAKHLLYQLYSCLLHRFPLYQLAQDFTIVSAECSSGVAYGGSGLSGLSGLTNCRHTTESPELKARCFRSKFQVSSTCITNSCADWHGSLIINFCSQAKVSSLSYYMVEPEASFLLDKGKRGNFSPKYYPHRLSTCWEVQA